MAAADLALRFRAPFIAHLLSHHPSGAQRVELEPEDVPSVILADGNTLDSWIANVEGESLKYYRDLCSATSAPEGPLITAMHVSGQGPIRIYDGWHRIAAWYTRNRSGTSSNISAHLILLTRS